MWGSVKLNVDVRPETTPAELQENEISGEYKAMPFNLKGRNVLITGGSR